jgi:hypothetical protein
MSKSAKANLGHRRRLTHAAKRKIAVGMKTAEFEQFPGVFNKYAWRVRKMQIINRVRRSQVRAHYYSELRKGER